jgi:hypothetical protein
MHSSAFTDTVQSSMEAPNAGAQPRQQPQRGTSRGCWRRLQRFVRLGLSL